MQPLPSQVASKSTASAPAEAPEPVIETTTQSGGMFTSSVVYVFAQSATLEQRVGALEVVPAPARDRLREALVAAEWTPPTQKP